MPQFEWKVTTAEDMARADAAQQLPSGCCPYVGAPQFNGAAIRRCRVCTTTACTPAEFTNPIMFNQCIAKRQHDAYLLHTGDQGEIKAEEVNSNRMVKKFE
ncbi:hypothetical protein [Candidatus Bathycorpusculum sp.]|uniref:hypothetical protein n=1 Tax=Candidatus Bathycorpusculum sp. TaxID=2994959 RepID=UPI0028355CC5|nr:hypothetical protein [Candidatus Termitimicrobium sp.]MCL2685943.1 hypothetical protein [Candidatus Termitimicrobium sp.]